MSDLAKIGSAWLFAGLVLYGVFAFVSMEPNPKNWTEVGRGLLAWLWLMSLFPAVAVVKHREMFP